MGKMFDLLKEGLEEAIEFHKGNVKLRTKEAFIPDAPKNYKAQDIKNLRKKLDLSQKVFAAWLNVSLNTIQSWEQGARKPNHAALRLLEMFEKGFSAVENICKSEPKTKKSKLQKRIASTTSSERTSRVAIAAKAKH